MIFSLAIAVCTALLFGLAPALQTGSATWSSRSRDRERRAEDSGAAGCATRSSSSSRAVADAAAGAGLLMRTFVNLQQVDWG